MRRTVCRQVLPVVMVISFLEVSLSAQDCWEGQRIFASDAAVADWFGASVAIDGPLMVVGAHGNDDDGPDAGSAYVWRFDSTSNLWVEGQKLTPGSLGDPGDRFGYAVAIDNPFKSMGSGATIVVGAYRDDDVGNDVGAVYVYRHDGERWVLEDKVDPGGFPRTGDEFGVSVSVQGDLMVVGAHYDDQEAMDAGAAYVFEFNPVAGHWVQLQKLTAGASGVANAYFGAAVAHHGDTVFIGAWNESATYIFDRNVGTGAWNQSDRLAPSGGSRFGISLALNNRHAVIGATLDDEFGLDHGAAFVYRRRVNGQWTLDEKIADCPSRLPNFDYFGSRVAISGTRILVGALGEAGGGWNDAGAGYLFHHSEGQWLDYQKMVPSNSIGYLRMGRSADLSGDFVAMGSTQEDTFGDRAGAVYCYWTSLNLRAETSASRARGGHRLKFDVSCGPENAPLVIALVGVDHQPVFKPVLFGEFRRRGYFKANTWVPVGSVPPGTIGSFQVFSPGMSDRCSGHFDHIRTSNVFDVTFQ